MVDAHAEKAFQEQGGRLRQREMGGVFVPGYLNWGKISSINSTCQRASALLEVR